MREAVRAADDEGLEGVLGVEPRVVVASRPKSLNISIGVAVTIGRLDRSRLRPRRLRLRTALVAEVVLVRKTLVTEGLLAEAVLAVTLTVVVMVIRTTRFGELGGTALSRPFVVGRLVLTGVLDRLQGLIHDDG